MYARMPTCRHRMRSAAVLAAIALLASPLTGAAHADSTFAALTGVVSLDGTPVPGATVTLTILPAPGTFTDAPYRAEPTAMGRTGSDGRFEIPLPAVDQHVIDLASINSDTINYWIQAFYNDAQRS
jgi:hypothetical protein